MEKIYMEGNNNNKKKKSSIGQVFSSQLPGRLVFFGVLVAFCSFLAMGTMGTGQVSYAIPEVTSALPDTFTTAPVSKMLRGNSSGYGVSIFCTNSISGVAASPLCNGGVEVFCLESDIEFDSNGGVKYAKGNSISDYGLLYLMANSYPNVKFKDANGVDLPNELQSWITQIAVWDYLGQTSAENNTKFIKDPLYSKILSDTYVDYILGGSGSIKATNGIPNNKTLYTAYVEPLVKDAIANKNVPNKQLNITKQNDEISMTADKKYYQSSLITVTGSPSKNFNGFQLSLASAPEGTIFVDENGKQITNLDNLSTNTKFYVRVPIDKINEKNKVVKVSATGSFTTYEGNYYTAKDKQTITSVKTVNNNINKGVEIELNYTPPVPDTGMTTAQSIYFIGLIVLLCGVGIIYASARPKYSK